ncbi:hATC-domain-containing protein, partial [Fistulina hepatica ATCC 64428]
EIEWYLSIDPEDAKDVVKWWLERRALYPHLSQMAIDYLSIPATSVDVEHLFSKGRLILSHVHSRMSVQTTCALMCLNSWSKFGLIRDEDVLAVARSDDVPRGEKEPALKPGWASVST